MTISNKFSVLAIVPETTEGTPVSPSAATQYTPIQPGIVIKPAVDVNQNAELVASIGARKSILGAEKPTFTLSHYLKPSGVAGTAPDWSPVLEGAFGTKTVIGGSEETLTSGSTTTTLAAASGHGANFAKGRPVLVKDPVNGTSIRFVESVATDALSLSFALPGAPASGVKVGKPVFYTPAQSGHKPYSIWLYLGNGGAKQMMAGSKFTKFSYSATAGGLINCSIDAEGVGAYFNPVELTEEKYLDFTDDTGTAAAAVAAGMYKTPKALADALQSAMAAANPAKTPSVTYDNKTGKFTIKTTGTLLSLLFNTGTNTAHTIATVMGFSAAADATGSGATTGYTSATALDLTAPQTPTYDDADPIAAKAQEIMIGDQTDYEVFQASDFTYELDDTRSVKKDMTSDTGIGGSAITARAIKWTAKGYLDQYDVSKFDRFRENTDTRLQHSFGIKSGGQWVEGSCGGTYISTATITSVDIGDDNGIATIEIQGEGFVSSDASAETSLGFL